MLTVLFVMLLVPLQSIGAQHNNELEKSTTLGQILSELKTLKETCKGEEKCATDPQNGANQKRSTDIALEKCGCKADCAIYGDCCRDSFFFSPNETSYSRYTCVPTLSEETLAEPAYYIIAKCPENTSPAQRRLCENPRPTSDPIANNIPVTVPTLKIGSQTYLNLHCARCNGAQLASAAIWRPHVVCYDVASSLVNDTTFKVKWNATTEKWTVTDQGKSARYDCEMKFTPPDTINDLRRCRNGGFVDKCLPRWQGTHEERMCKSFTAIIMVNSTNYRNVYCAKCNDANESHATCIEVEFRSFHETASFANLLKVKDECKVGQIYDPIFEKCRSLNCGRKGCGEIENVREPNRPNVPKIENCVKVRLDNGTFELSADNRFVKVPKYKRNFSQGEFSVTDKGIEICKEDVPQSSSIMSIVTVCGLGVSIFFLVLHLCAVALVQDLRNHSGMNLSSLCVALLGAYISFIAGALLKESPGGYCFVFAFLTYFFFTSAFFWMLIIAFDVWRVLRGAVRYFKSSSGRQYGRFLIYSLFSWGVPAVLTASALAVDSAARGTVDEVLRPKFGETSCWFSQQLSMVVFFASPLALIMALNVMFFVSSAYMASTSRMSSPSSNVSGHQRDFRLYLRLAILLGLTWIIGLLAAALDKEPLWVCFVLLNTLQGLFIFAMFTCTSKVLKGLSKPHPWVNRIRESLRRPSAKPTDVPPSSDVRFSQSTSDTTLKSSSNTTSVEISSQDRRSPSAAQKPSIQLQIAGHPRRPSL